jgi:ribonuclease P protein component
MATRKAIEEMKTSFNKKMKYAIFAKAKVYDVDFQIMVDELKKKFKEVKYH